VLDLLTFIVALAAGGFGALIGVGGGLILVPLLTVVLGVDVHHAIAASLLGVIATSAGASAAFLRSGLVDRRLGLGLEVATAIGAIAGGFAAGLLDGRTLSAIFGIVLLGVALNMARRPGMPPPEPAEPPGTLEFDSSYIEPTTGEEVNYRVRRPGVGALVAALAGVLSGMLGIGGGVIKVPTMNMVMGVPMRVAAATSTFMLGFTASASAVLYLARGDVDTAVAAPVVLGVFVGARVGTRLAHGANQKVLQLVFAVAAMVFAIQMLARVVGAA
jgi:uncharacterized membrane protein YfcA